MVENPLMCSDIHVRTMLVLCDATMITMIIMVSAGSMAAASEPKGVPTGEDAVNAFIKALKERYNEDLLTLCGDGANELIYSGDAIADRQGREVFVKAYDEQHTIESAGNNLALVIGRNDRPWPIPVIEQGQQWLFDTASGKQEILNRRIRRNELYPIQVMLAIVDARREYAMKDHDDDGLLEHAQKCMSDPDKTWKQAQSKDKHKIE